MKGPRLDDIHGFAHSFSSKVLSKYLTIKDSNLLTANNMQNSRIVDTHVRFPQCARHVEICETLKLRDRLYTPTLRLWQPPRLQTSFEKCVVKHICNHEKKHIGRI